MTPGSNAAAPARATLLVAGIFALALCVRLFGIGVESIWVDEAFSVAASEGELSQVLDTLARDTHPPGYFLGLQLWRSAVADSDAGMRAFSTLWSLIGLLFLLLLVRDTLGAAPALLAGLFMALNPLDVYFAQEVRMYAQAAALGSASAWLLWRWLEARRTGPSPSRGAGWAAGYAVAAALLLYTHYVTATLLLAQGIYALGCLAARRSWRDAAAYVGLGLAVGLCFLPWLVYVLGFHDSFYAGAVLSYMPVPGLVDYLSLPGREWLWGRARGIHDAWWGLTLLLPLSLFAAAGWALRARAASDGERRALVFVAWLVVVPLLITALVGWSWEIVYFRPRYPVLILPGFLALLAWACTRLPRRALAGGAALLCAGVMCAGLAAQHLTPQKRAWRETAQAWPDVTPPAFYVILPPEQQRPLNHYLDGRIRHTPRAVLERLMPLPEGTLIWVGTWPEGPGPAGQEYLRWLQGLGGEAGHLLLPSYYSITQVAMPGPSVPREVAAGRFRHWYGPIDVRGGVSGFSDARLFSEIAFDADGRAHRFSRPRAWLRLEEVGAAERVVLRAALSAGAGEDGDADRGVGGGVRVFASRRAPHSGLFGGGESEHFELRGGEPRDLILTAPPGGGPLWLGWQLTGSAAARDRAPDAGGSPQDGPQPAGAAHSRRLRIDGIGIEAVAATPAKAALAAAGGE